MQFVEIKKKRRIETVSKCTETNWKEAVFLNLFSFFLLCFASLSFSRKHFWRRLIDWNKIREGKKIFFALLTYKTKKFYQYKIVDFFFFCCCLFTYCKTKQKCYLFKKKTVNKIWIWNKTVDQIGKKTVPILYQNFFFAVRLTDFFFGVVQKKKRRKKPYNKWTECHWRSWIWLPIDTDTIFTVLILFNTCCLLVE